MPPEDAATFKRTLELGRELARTLDASDILGRWMAHHVAELITRAENASADQRDELRAVAADTILRLWKHRAGSPRPDIPLASFEPILAALDRLSGPQPPWAFYRTFTEEGQPDENDTAIVPMLQCALNLEDAIRDVVLEVIVQATREASKREEKWLKLSDHLTEDARQRLVHLLRRAISRDRQLDGEQDGELIGMRIEPIVDRLKDLESMITATRSLLEEVLAAQDDAADE